MYVGLTSGSQWKSKYELNQRKFEFELNAKPHSVPKLWWFCIGLLTLSANCNNNLFSCMGPGNWFCASTGEVDTWQSFDSREFRKA